MHSRALLSHSYKLLSGLHQEHRSHSFMSTPRVWEDILAGSTRPINLPPVYYPRVARDMTASLLMPPPPPPPSETLLGSRVREDPSEPSMKRQRSCSPQGLYPLICLLSLSRCGQTQWSSWSSSVADLGACSSHNIYSVFSSLWLNNALFI